MLRDFLTFRRMLTPIIIQALFWVAVIVCIITGFYNFFHHAFIPGLQVLFLGPLLLRLLCEFLILFFRMNETITELKNAVQEKVESVKA